MDNDLRMGIVRVELTHTTAKDKRCMDETIRYYRDVVSFLLHVACDHLEEIRPLSSQNETGYMDSLVHYTKDNPDPAYPTFDMLFNRFPSYFRRAAEHDACGQVRSHESNCDNYEEWRDNLVSRGKHVKKMAPGFTYTPNSCPTMYKGNMFKRDGRNVLIKVRDGKTWRWIALYIPTRDWKRLVKAKTAGTVMNPALIHAYGKYYLVFPVKYDGTAFPKTPIDKQTVLGTDLGLNNGAVCSVVDAYGSIHGRYFSPFKAEMARIDHIINLIRKKSRTSGTGQSLASLYTKLAGLKEDYCRRLSRWIVNRAIENNVYGIVLEHLGKMKGRGSLASRVHHWCTAKIRDYVKGMAFRAGIRVFIINPRGTSMYAFNGSGEVSRDSSNYSLCTFADGKRYNCDLSASYNIGARYFLRALKKSTPATEWSGLKVKIPELAKGTRWTLHTLRAIAAA